MADTQSPVPAPTPSLQPHPQRGIHLRLPRLALSFKEVVVALLIINGFTTAGLWISTVRNKPPVIATVAVTKLTRLYEDKLAGDPNTTPQERQLKTALFLQGTRKAIQDLAAKKGALVLARECVLTGEGEDLTPQLEQTVNSVLSQPAAAAQTGGIDETLVQ